MWGMIQTKTKALTECSAYIYANSSSSFSFPVKFCIGLAKGLWLYEIKSCTNLKFPSNKKT